ncbi:hypothetical protein AwDysgo_01830 [Bacteroidales bacterium]|nr:hypothetical protein AwDysgo_01830 [Bacteroidales bacterium]
MKKSNYDKFHATKVEGNILKGWAEIVSKFSTILKSTSILAVDMYVGVHEVEVLSALNGLNEDVFIKTRDLFKSESEIVNMTNRFVTDYSLFVYITHLTMADYFDDERLAIAKKEIENTKGKVIIMGSGASIVAPQNTYLVFADMARWEIQFNVEKYSNKLKAKKHDHFLIPGGTVHCSGP